MPSGMRRVGTATGPGHNPRLVPEGASPWAASDQARQTELRFLAIELIPNNSAQGKEAGGGIIDAQLQTPNDRVWLVERIAVSSTSSSATTARVYLGSVDPANLVDATDFGEGDIADEVNPIVVPAGQTLRVRWTGASAGAVGTVTIQGKAGALTQVQVS